MRDGVAKPHVALLCATNRGRRVLEHLVAQLPEAQLTVCSFREEPHEPPFLDEIRRVAADCNARFFETRRAGSPKMLDYWRSSPPDLMLVVSWRYLIPSEAYRLAHRGTYVFHDSLLPAYRGFAPTVWAIVNGEVRTGATVFAIADEVDSGDIVDQQEVPIGPGDTISEVMGHVTGAYLQLLTRNLAALLTGTPRLRRQDHARASYTCKRLPEDNRIDWAWSAQRVHNLVRAVSYPYPGAFTTLGGQRLRIWSAQNLDRSAVYVGSVPGRVVEIRPDHGSVVLTGDGSLLVRKVQWDDGDVLCASQALNSPSMTLGR
jgi:methionyl-tRNA formyltransferase